MRAANLSSILNVHAESWINHRANQRPYLDIAVYEILESAFVVLTKAFRKLPDETINVSWWPEHPRSLYDYRPYEIRINSEKLKWSKYVYQFSHELCHVLSNFDRCKEHKHKWFEESICEMASLFVLRELSHIWIVDPPQKVLEAAQFAPNHAAYVDKFIAEHKVPDREELIEWLASNISAMEQNSTNRDLNAIMSLSLLNLFLEDPSLWEECGYLNLWNAHDDTTFQDHLDSWEECLQENGFNIARVSTIIRGMFCS